MITCIICKEAQHESYFVKLKRGGLAICINCQDSDEAKKLEAETDVRIEARLKKMDEYEAIKRKRRQHETYPGEFDWM